MSDIKCRFCESPIPEAQIDSEKNIAECLQCNSVYSLEDDSANQSQEALPKHMLLEKEENELYVAEKRFTPINLLYLIGMLILVAGYVAFRVFVMRQFVTAYSTRYPFYISMLQFAFIVGIAGLGYFFAAAFANTTHVIVDRVKLTLRYGPVPWPGNRSIDFDILTDVVSTKIGKAYGLTAVLKSGERHTVLKRFTSPEQALYVERQIETMLIRE